jgi:hypothetical protein
LDALARLEFDQEGGYLLSGDLSGIPSLDITIKGSGAFRAAYEVDELQGTCMVFAIGPHKEFYDRLRRRLNG